MIKKNTSEIVFILLILSFSLIIASSIPVPLLADWAKCNAGYCSCECSGIQCSCSTNDQSCHCECTEGSTQDCFGVKKEPQL